MVEAFEFFGNKAWHGSVNVFFGVVHVEGDTAILLSFPVDGTYVVVFYCADEVEVVLFVEVMYA